MEKFSKIKPDKKDKNEDEVLYKDKFVQVIKCDGWSGIKEKDTALCIIYLIDTNQIVIRNEYIPTFKHVDGQEYHLSLIGGGIEDGETPEEALLREIQEEAGIVIRSNFKIEMDKPLFANKGHLNKYYSSIITLTENDYHEVRIKGDGTKEENISKTVKVDVKYINSLNASDMVTQYMLDKVKKYLNIK